MRKEEVYIVRHEWSNSVIMEQADYIEVFATLETARKRFGFIVEEERKYAEEEGYIIEDDMPDSFLAYLPGYGATDYATVYIIKERVIE